MPRFNFRSTPFYADLGGSPDNPNSLGYRSQQRGKQVRATIAHYCQQHPGWTVADLAAHCHLSERQIRRHLATLRQERQAQAAQTSRQSLPAQNP